MVFPTEIEEILSDVAAPSVVMPRRQSGSSSQGLAITLMADYTLRHTSWLPAAALVSLLSEFEVTYAAARLAISRLGRRGVLEARRCGRRSFYRLSQRAAAELSGAGGLVADFAAEPRPAWDGSWTFVTFSMPQEDSTPRNTLRVRLRRRGFAPLYDGVWVSPQPLNPQDRADLVPVAGAMTVLRAEHLPLASDADRSPVTAWDLEAIAEMYEAFVQEWSTLLPRIAAGEVNGAEAVRARTEVMATFRRFPMIDPELPPSLLPPEWPRVRAREVFVGVYNGLSKPAEAYVRGVATEVSDQPLEDLQAHTIAEMRAGIRSGRS